MYVYCRFYSDSSCTSLSFVNQQQYAVADCFAQPCSASPPGTVAPGPYSQVTCVAESVSLAPAFAPPPPPSPASVQIVNYASPSVCSGPITGATTFSTGVCLQFSVTSGNSSIVTKTGNVVSAQGYADSSCQTALGPSESIRLNTCTVKGGNALIAYAYAPNTIPPAPFTSTTGQVTATYA